MMCIHENAMGKGELAAVRGHLAGHSFRVFHSQCRVTQRSAGIPQCHGGVLAVARRKYRARMAGSNSSMGDDLVQVDLGSCVLFCMYARPRHDPDGAAREKLARRGRLEPGARAESVHRRIARPRRQVCRSRRRRRSRPHDVGEHKNGGLPHNVRARQHHGGDLGPDEAQRPQGGQVDAGPPCWSRGRVEEHAYQEALAPRTGSRPPLGGRRCGRHGRRLFKSRNIDQRMR